MGTTWTPEKTAQIEALLADIDARHDAQVAQDAKRYRLLRGLIKQHWPKDVIGMARDGQDLDKLVDLKAEEISRTLAGYGVAI